MKRDLSYVGSNERFAIAIATLLYGKPSARSGDPLGKATGPRGASESNKPSLGAKNLFFEMRIRNSFSVPLCLCGKKTLFPSFPPVQSSDIPLNPTNSQLKNLMNYPDAHVSDFPPSGVRPPFSGSQPVHNQCSPSSPSLSHRGYASPFLRSEIRAPRSAQVLDYQPRLHPIALDCRSSMRERRACFFILHSSFCLLPKGWTFIALTNTSHYPSRVRRDRQQGSNS
jgi:hypothetical protein